MRPKRLKTRDLSSTGAHLNRGRVYKPILPALGVAANVAKL